MIFPLFSCDSLIEEANGDDGHEVKGENRRGKILRDREEHTHTHIHYISCHLQQPTL
jgi:hypothetical protein